MSDDAQNDINNVTSGKGNVNSTTGIVVLASNQTTERYWHYFNALGGGGGNATPVCSNRSLTVAQDSGGGNVAPSCTDSDSGPSALTYDDQRPGHEGRGHRDRRTGHTAAALHPERRPVRRRHVHLHRLRRGRQQRAGHRQRDHHAERRQCDAGLQQPEPDGSPRTAAAATWRRAAPIPTAARAP